MTGPIIYMCDAEIRLKNAPIAFVPCFNMRVFKYPVEIFVLTTLRGYG
jgi:hypothetical protein